MPGTAYILQLVDVDCGSAVSVPFQLHPAGCGLVTALCWRWPVVCGFGVPRATLLSISVLLPTRVRKLLSAEQDSSLISSGLVDSVCVCEAFALMRCLPRVLRPMSARIVLGT